MVICGGQENMSLSPHFIHLRESHRMGAVSMMDSLLVDGLVDAMHSIHMGVTAENLADKYHITRYEQDKYAALSQNRAEFAQKHNFFDAEITPIMVPSRKGESSIVDQDEYIKTGITIQGLQQLKCCFVTVNVYSRNYYTVRL